MNEKLRSLLDTVQRTAVQINETADAAAHCVSRKASELLSVAKLNIRVADLTGEVDLRLQELGQMLYDTHTGAPTDSEVLLAKLREVDGLKAQIRALNDEIGQEQCRVPVCPACGAAACAGDVYCRECGGKL